VHILDSAGLVEPHIFNGNNWHRERDGGGRLQLDGDKQ
jgi:hypothetical protein